MGPFFQKSKRHALTIIPYVPRTHKKKETWKQTTLADALRLGWRLPDLRVAISSFLLLVHERQKTKRSPLERSFQPGGRSEDKIFQLLRWRLLVFIVYKARYNGKTC